MPKLKYTPPGIGFLDTRYLKISDAITDFTGLSDTPANYTGAGGKAVAVNGAADGLEFIDFPAGGATTALDNLASVAINSSLLVDTDSAYDLGSATKYWANLYVDTIVIPNTQATVSITGWDAGQTRHQGISITNNVGYAYIVIKGDQDPAGDDAGYIIFESGNYTKAAANHGYISYFQDDMQILAKGILKLSGSSL